MGLDLPASALLNAIQVEIEFPSTEFQDNISATGKQATTPVVIPDLSLMPKGAIIKRVALVALITALNNSANAQNIGLTVQGTKNGGPPFSWFEENTVIGFGATQNATTSIATVQDITGFVNDTTSTYAFNFLVDQSSANSVIYTCQYLLVVTYGFV